MNNKYKTNGLHILECQDNASPQEVDLQYEKAYKRVKQIKGFYVHAMVYILVNAVLFILDYSDGERLSLDDLFTPGLWGVGLAAHAGVVFLPNFIFGDNWEERKIKELMDKEKDNA